MMAMYDEKIKMKNLSETEIIINPTNANLLNADLSVILEAQTQRA